MHAGHEGSLTSLVKESDMRKTFLGGVTGIRGFPQLFVQGVLAMKGETAKKTLKTIIFRVISDPWSFVRWETLKDELRNLNVGSINTPRNRQKASFKLPI